MNLLPCYKSRDNIKEIQHVVINIKGNNENHIDYWR